jgi:transcriptional regulator with XRE-family HTH domain
MNESASLIRQARVAQGLTQAELARRLGITQPSVARMEAAGDAITLATLRRALRALGRSLVLQVGAAETSSVDESQLLELIRLEPEARLNRFESAYRGVQEIAAAGAHARGMA